jgi:hypothetical protein
MITVNVSIGFAILGVDYLAKITARITSRSHDGSVGFNGLYGPDAPTGCEYEIEDIELHEDAPTGLGPALEVPGWLREIINESDALADAVQDAERELPRETRGRGDERHRDERK